MRRLIYGLLGLIFFAGCNSGTPKGVIAEKNMVAVLKDMHLADGYVGSVPSDSVKILTNSLYGGIYKKYHTDSAGLRASIAYYAAQPQLFDAMYTQVQDQLQQLVDSAAQKEEVKQREIQRKDSVRYALKRDSLRKVQRDSADLKIKQHLLYWVSADSSQLKPGPWAKETAHFSLLLQALGYPDKSAKTKDPLSPNRLPVAPKPLPPPEESRNILLPNKPLNLKRGRIH